MEACYIPYSFKKIDWNYAMNADEEWIFMLNRQEYLLDLAEAYADSRDQKYLECWKRLVFDWIEHNPFTEGKIHTSWRTIDTGIRCASWMKSMMILQESLLNHELETIFSSLREQIIFLKDHYLERYTLSNWGALQISGILQTVMVCEDLVPKEIMDWAWNELKRQCEIQFFADGVHWEQSPLYHFEVLFAVVEIYKEAEVLGITLPVDLKSVIQKTAIAANYMIYPNGYLVPQHDSDYVNVEAVYKKLPSFCQGSLPELFIGDASGNFVYKTEKDFVSLWNGWHGSGHGHASLGHLNVFLNGERVLCDSGRFTYQEGPLRSYLKSVHSHSTVIVDELPFTSIKDTWSFHHIGKKVGNKVKETSKYIVMESAFYYATYLVQRTVIILKKESIVIVIDDVEAQGQHTMKRLFQLNPDITVGKQKDCWKLTAKKNVAYAYFSDMEDTHSKVTLSSTQYNRLTNRTTLVDEKEFVDHGIRFSIFSGKPLEVMLNHIEQCGAEQSPSEQYFLSFHLKTDSSDYDIYFAANETHIGERIYKHNDDYFYHRLTISKNGQKEVIL
ncbi:heparinase II/III family protein [Sporosarcina sp. YIM B06819]|uniref:heparinase II/III family protein n=1 Tax=Sporosarcina sp. YIM B06819 TaxID=3081769 RepID=UPI00298BE83D|nr:heparinase II/III family protein [Sporosarcina sp. YIM B06819]